MKRIETAYSTKKPTSEAVREVVEHMGSLSPKMVTSSHPPSMTQCQ